VYKASIHSTMERDRVANPDRAGQRHRVAYAIVEGREHVADGESLELWARFDAAGYLWLDFHVVGTTEPKVSHPVGGAGSAVQRIEPILFA